MSDRPDALAPFPEVIALGRERIQNLCDEWSQTPQAKECGVVRVDLAGDGLNFRPVFFLHAKHHERGDAIIFPFDRMLSFIIDRGCDEAAGEGIKARLRMLRQRVGPSWFQRYEINRAAYTMGIECPGCGMLIVSQWRIFAGQAFELEGTASLTCPRCKLDTTASQDRFFPVIDPGYFEA